MDPTTANNVPDLLIRSSQPLTAKSSKEQVTYLNQFQDKMSKYSQSSAPFKENVNKQASSAQPTQALLSQTNSPKTNEAKKGELMLGDTALQTKQLTRNDYQKNTTAGSTLSGVYSPQARKQINFTMQSQQQPTQTVEPNISVRKNSKPNLKEQHQVSTNRSGHNNPDVKNFLEEFATPNEETTTNSAKGNQNKYQEIIKNLSEKNQELEILGKENTELKSTLGFLANELRELKKMKSEMAEKDQLIAQLKSTLGNTLQESQDLHHDIEKDPPLKERLESPNNPLSKPSSQEKMNSHVQPRSPEKKLSLMEQLKHHNINSTTNNQGANTKKPGSSYMLSNLEYRNERNSNPVNAMSQGQLYQRNFSTTLETGKKKFELPHYEQLIGTKKDGVSNEYLVETQKKQPESRGNSKKPATMTQANKKTPVSSLNFKKGELSEILRKGSAGKMGGLQITNDPQSFGKNLGAAPNSTAGSSFDPTKRKFSHDPKGSSGLAITATLSDSGQANPSSFRGDKSYSQGTGKPLDIAAGLNAIKERIRMMLDKHRDHHNSLKQTNALILEKLEKLASDQSTLAN